MQDMQRSIEEKMMEREEGVSDGVVGTTDNKQV